MQTCNRLGTAPLYSLQCLSNSLCHTFFIFTLCAITAARADRGLVPVQRIELCLPKRRIYSPLPNNQLGITGETGR